MKFKLNKHWIKYLLDLPESGMGYQKVNITLNNGEVLRNVIVYNAEIFEYSHNNSLKNSSDIVNIELVKKSK